MTDDLDLHGLALQLHRSYDWMQKNWRRLVADEGFPPPFVGREPGARPWWRAALVEAWKDRNHDAQGWGRLAQPTETVANDALPTPRGDRASALIKAAG